MESSDWLIKIGKTHFPSASLGSKCNACLELVSHVNIVYVFDCNDWGIVRVWGYLNPGFICIELEVIGGCRTDQMLGTVLYVYV